ncbi:hypothetical protein [Streptomyces sp. NPDC005336]|uniref:hypothetical protein n=1 Tax=Streptomyces sp. NPDC005336 TaxID=3157035 RepID=UPI00339F04EB
MGAHEGAGGATRGGGEAHVLAGGHQPRVLRDRRDVPAGGAGRTVADATVALRGRPQGAGTERGDSDALSVTGLKVRAASPMTARPRGTRRS